MAEDGVKEFCIKEGVDELPDDEIPWTRPVKNPSNAFAKAPQVNATSEEDIQPSENNEEEFKPLDGLSSTEAASNNRKRKVPDSGSSVPVVDIDGDDDAIDVDADVSGATGNDVPLVQQPPVKRTRRSNHGFASSGGYINYGAGPPPAANPLDELQEWNRQLWGKVTATSTGRFGERYVAETLRRTHRENPNVRVNWINELEETGEKWDIEVITKMGEGRDDKIQYVEVKTTRFADKKWFEMSHRELTMALKEGPNFTVVRVFLNIQDLGGDVANFEPVLVYLDDFESLFRQGKVKVRVEM
ncbi:hypothetical protein M427DRAFT_27471 [Gonapodya prolifera JEL478]|uniref:Protein NO VEIN C-terminal domain-containing protein n=1 Tax=Gonapodya prolifera (strain JEL478) TaxID=1344416 RepID=A0A139AYX9_GONPJ|nr:hypothetical protein M427DRAFT_27471 [Gonapodya prolifera JEL478]|eukprot:KXS21941.1 hypothetical protein M427DRAFT_27471 [Gonapodya prolifera JEL478]